VNMVRRHTYIAALDFDLNPGWHSFLILFTAYETHLEC
jgi:hypothetical protein